ncbi:hypothetical protein IE53DRAFT_390682 [Violaceomyces palustris]|uniref:Uncharacterized protein n=1 Tax=Violaceomyces palustris TaxID=1673888 RepID=A0ACD0NMZ1_9BASI|nr:hypothetical protein IE53DRAFT_390682 [Violaceomyces palustris]
METEGEAVPIHKTDAELEMETVKVTVGKGREASWSIDDPKPCSSGGKDQGEETRSTPDVRTGSPSETIQDGFCCCSSSQPSRPTAALERESSSVSGERKLRLNGEYTEAEILEILSQARRR